MLRETLPFEPSDVAITTCPPVFLATYSELLDELYAQSRAARWNVARKDFAGALYRSALSHFGGAVRDAPHDDAAVETYLRTLRLEDLALACALRLGSHHAWEEFVANYRPLLYAAARAIVAERGEAYARDLADSLYAELYGLDSSGAVRRHSLLEYFHGRSKLATWLRAVLAQRYVDALRATRRMEPLPDAASGATPDAIPGAMAGAMALEMEDSVEHGSRAGASAIRAYASSRSANFGREFGDPDRARLMPRLRDALLAAFALLAPSDRMLLSLYYLDNLTLAHIARMRHVHEATISRQLDRIRRELREAVTRMLATDRAAQNGCAAGQRLTAAEIELCFTYVLEDWAFDLNQALRENGAATTTRHNDAEST